MLNPTIEIDGIAVWEQGVFHAERLQGGQDVLDAYPCAAAVFKNPDPNIGMDLQVHRLSNLRNRSDNPKQMTK